LPKIGDPSPAKPGGGSTTKPPSGKSPPRPAPIETPKATGGGGGGGGYPRYPNGDPKAIPHPVTGQWGYYDNSGVWHNSAQPVSSGGGGGGSSRSSGGGGGRANPFPYEEGGYAGQGVGPTGQLENRYYVNGGIKYESQLGEYQAPQQPRAGAGAGNQSPFPVEEGQYAGTGIGPSGQLEASYWQNGQRVWESQLGEYTRPKPVTPAKRAANWEDYWAPPMEGDSFSKIDPRTGEWANFYDFDGDGYGEWGFAPESGGGSSGGGGGGWTSGGGGGGWSGGGSYGGGYGSGGGSDRSTPTLNQGWSSIETNDRTWLSRAMAGMVDWSDPAVAAVLKKYGLTAGQALELYMAGANWTGFPRQPAASMYS
jgi:hypothetical protein